MTVLKASPTKQLAFSCRHYLLKRCKDKETVAIDNVGFYCNVFANFAFGKNL
jgi:hypothetical protein